MRPFLALLLFLPAFAILSALYLHRPARARWSLRMDWLLLARIFHKPTTAAADHHAVARFAPVCRLNVEQTTPSPPNSPRTAPRRALGGLATHVHETSGLALAAAITCAFTVWSFHQARAQDVGQLWPDIAGALAAFHSFPFLLALAWWWRRTG